jgi:acetate kinase
MNEAIVVLNAGSTSLKFAAYTAATAEASLLFRGRIIGLQTHPMFVVEDSAGKVLAERDLGGSLGRDHMAMLNIVTTWLQANLNGAKIVAAGHRIVQGGIRFADPTLIDDEILDYLDTLAAIEPLHQPFNVGGARAFAQAFPGLPQVACFDTSFHRSMPDVAQTYALPKEVRDTGVRHWGYHGISYDYISRQVHKAAPDARRVIAAHLGGGASLCAMLDGKSIDTSMGFAALSGLPMATRSGDIPAGALLYLLRSKQFDEASLEAMLYERSGLFGLSEISGDMKVLQESADLRAVGAVDAFIYAMTKYVGAYAAVLGGLDALVFTAGIGENSPLVRAALCRKLTWLGVTLDDEANDAGRPRISAPGSPVSVWVIPTNEELMIAQQTVRLTTVNECALTDG